MEILLVGFYSADQIASFVQSMSKEYKLSIRYLQEFAPLGTAGGQYTLNGQLIANCPILLIDLNIRRWSL